MKKILCVIDSLGSGGAQRQLVELAKGFKGEGYDVSFLTYHHSDFFLSDLNNSGIECVCLNEPSYIKRLWRVRRFIRHGGFDVVLSFLEVPNFICELAGFPFRNWKLIVGERSANPAILTSFRLRSYRFFHVLADFVVANSNQNMDMVKKANPFLPQDKCKVIYNMIDLRRWSQSDCRVPNNGGQLTIVVAARHHYLKNARGLIEALNMLDASEHDRLLVNWYGREDSDNSLAEARDLVTRYSLQEVIKFHQATRNIEEVISNSGAVALFSFYEGLPNTVCEGMAAGKIVISSRVSDVPLFLAHSPQCIFDPVSAADIARTLKYVLSLPEEERRQMEHQNKIVAENLFSPNYILSEYISLF